MILLHENRRLAVPALAWVLLAIVLGFGGVALADAASHPTATSRPAINAMCPVMPDEEVDPEITTTHRGKTIAFCCDRCLEKFKADPDKYFAKVVSSTQATVASGNSGAHDHGGASHGHQDEGGDHASEEGAHSANETGVDANDEGGHDHGAGDGSAERSPILGRLHPVIVHFPVAGIPLALLGFLAWVVTGREMFAKADVPALLVATLGAVAAVLTGNIAHDSMRFSSSMHEVVERHQLVATTVMVIALVTVIFRIWRWNRMTGHWRWVYGGVLLVASLLLGVTGFLGGTLVFGPDHLRW